MKTISKAQIIARLQKSFNGVESLTDYKQRKDIRGSINSSFDFEGLSMFVGVDFIDEEKEIYQRFLSIGGQNLTYKF